MHCSSRYGQVGCKCLPFTLEQIHCSSRCKQAGYKCLPLMRPSSRLKEGKRTPWTRASISHSLQCWDNQHWEPQQNMFSQDSKSGVLLHFLKCPLWYTSLPKSNPCPNSGVNIKSNVFPHKKSSLTPGWLPWPHLRNLMTWASFNKVGQQRCKKEFNLFFNLF